MPHVYLKFQVIYHTSDYAAIVLYAASCAVMAFASLLLPIETRGRSMTVGFLFVYKYVTLQVHLKSYILRI